MANVAINVFPEREESEHDDGSITAQSDISLSFSIISKGMLKRLGVNYEPYTKEKVKDARGVQHIPIGKVELRWHKHELGKSHPEIFYVVDSMTELVILGRTAFAKTTQATGGSVQPIGLQQQTAGLHFPSMAYS